MSIAVTNKANSNRLLGIVRFYDEYKQFGFIDTNGYGIDEDNTLEKSNSIELYFSARDLIPGTFIFEGDWVSFIYERCTKKKRDHARQVRQLQYTIEEFSLAILYRDDYSRIFSRMEHHRTYSADVITTFSSNYLLEKKSDKQALFDSLISAYSKNLIDLPNIAQESSVVLSFVLNSSQEDIKIKDRCAYELCIINLAILEYNKLRDILNSQSSLTIPWGNTFNNCLRITHGHGISRICDAIYSTLDSKVFNSLMHYLSSDVCNLLFSADDVSLRPEWREQLFYYKHKDVSILLQDTMIDYWNEHAKSTPGWTLPGSTYYSYYTIPRNDLKAIGDFISTSNHSSNYLLFEAFIDYSMPSCIRSLKDFSFIESWLPIKSDSFLKKFFKQSSLIPQTTITRSLPRIGLSRLQSIDALRSIDEELLKPLTISIFIKVDIVSKQSRNITCSRGGHFTWGEGMVGEEYYNVRQDTVNYVLKAYIEKSRKTLLAITLENKWKEKIREVVKVSISKKLPCMMFVWSTMGEERIFQINISDFNYSSEMSYLFECSDKVISEEEI